MKIALIQMDVTIGEPDVNFEKAHRLMKQAMEQAPDIIVLPEMWNTGYALEIAEQIADIDGQRTKELFSSFAKENNVAIVGGSVLYRDSQSGNVTNTMFVFNEHGEQVLRYDKIHLFRLMDEDKFLTAGNTFGLFEHQGETIGTMICYDLRFPQLSRKLVNQGAKILINAAQWPTSRVDHWRKLLVARAIENQSFVVAVNRCGESRNTSFPGSSMVIDPLGEILLQGDSSEQIYYAEIDLSKVDDTRKHIPVLTDQRLDLY
ncbi:MULTISPECIES: carbon-nitrogen family hydrolase [Aneurinibacillus]|uniref:Carbon-nitrogen family hydrolase n=1 Tax=Aneurinibacillus thermoaerophilus TaxID=143495 RepID=A0A1G8EBV2_ANETH|nr:MULTISPECIES: carbon-nitrogen family hydrolase [Aneurinibacillus]AMA72405.1 nitrilase [Aneurinibacillus sp. XH2]MED0676352.1 carbon-nitrogen family hydrolase [Aneurinibacillus thermoaerophilus]MED0679877.1 carbon-nitrogen family hydrolase [Aneurinibacillus thermoaerophilus]MED0737883.1 carbon-nitrogen family hydrolase [Aneurinibacillus thermoaerophilus]MED0759162.1 carbon-nitrogen family hydrolase [Aneurinibacillus thermoaerophilus]